MGCRGEGVAKGETVTHSSRNLHRTLLLSGAAPALVREEGGGHQAGRDPGPRAAAVGAGEGQPGGGESSRGRAGGGAAGPAGFPGTRVHRQGAFKRPAPAFLLCAFCDCSLLSCMAVCVFLCPLLLLAWFRLALERVAACAWSRTDGTNSRTLDVTVVAVQQKKECYAQKEESFVPVSRTRAHLKV